MDMQQQHQSESMARGGYSRCQLASQKEKIRAALSNLLFFLHGDLVVEIAEMVTLRRMKNKEILRDT
jgi:hypothetical protein